MRNITNRLSILAGTLLIVFSGCQKESFLNEFSVVNQQTETVQLKSAKLKKSVIKNYMVLFSSETLPKGAESQLSNFGKIVKTIPEIGIAVVQPSIENFEEEVGKLSSVQAVVPDLRAKWTGPSHFITKATLDNIGKDEPYFPYQWGMLAIHAPDAWDAGYEGKNATVFILDSGIDADHEDLAPNLIKSLSTSFVPGESYNVGDSTFFSHGTHIAGIIAAADNQYGLIGVAPEAKIVAVKVISEKDESGDFSWINEGIIYAANKGADVINLSLGATFSKNGFFLDENNQLQKVPAIYIQYWIQAQQRAIDYAYKKGVTIVCSAGNEYANADGDGSILIAPAEMNHVIAVSATAPNLLVHDIPIGTEPDYDIPASYTNYGKSLIDLAAPGGDINFYPNPNYLYNMVLSTSSRGFAFAAGTSMAAPHVAGVAALIIGKNGGHMSPHMVTKQLLKTADKIDGNGNSSYFGKGRVNAYRAVTE